MSLLREWQSNPSYGSGAVAPHRAVSSALRLPQQDILLPVRLRRERELPPHPTAAPTMTSTPSRLSIAIPSVRPASAGPSGAGPGAASAYTAPLLIAARVGGHRRTSRRNRPACSTGRWGNPPCRGRRTGSRSHDHAGERRLRLDRGYIIAVLRVGQEAPRADIGVPAPPDLKRWTRMGHSDRGRSPRCVCRWPGTRRRSGWRGLSRACRSRRPRCDSPSPRVPGRCAHLGAAMGVAIPTTNWLAPLSPVTAGQPIWVQPCWPWHAPASLTPASLTPPASPGKPAVTDERALLAPERREPQSTSTPSRASILHPTLPG